MIDLVEAGKRGGSAPKHKWTEEKREIVRRDYQGTHASRNAIAGKLGVTPFAVQGQISKMGLCKRVAHRPWTLEEEARLAELAQRYSSHTIARKLHRSLNAVVVRMKRLGIDRKIRDGWYTKMEVAQMLGVDHKRIQAFIDAGKLKASWHDGHKPGRFGMSRWHIKDKDLRKFIIDHAIEFTGRNVDLFSIVHLVANSGRLGEDAL